MGAATLAMITDVDTLRALVTEKVATIAQRDETIAARDRIIVHRETKIAALTAEIARLRRVQFAARSERMDPDQRELFDEAMAADIAAVESELEALRSTPVAPSATPAPRVPPRRVLPPVPHPEIHPAWPKQPFQSLDEARQWVQTFVTWYNTGHRHSGIRFVTPTERHAGHDKAILAARTRTYEAAKERHPHRWRGRAVRNSEPIDIVWLNPDNVDRASPENLLFAA